MDVLQMRVYLEEVADACECIAGLEGLEAHRKSVSYRRR